jgi:signal transduction histidine kinase
MVEDVRRSDAGEMAGLIQQQGMLSLLAVPLLRGGELRGLVSIMTRRPRRYALEEVRLLTRLAQQTIVAIENAQLYQQVQYVSILEERERIAREIHDGLAQLVGSIRIWADEAELSLGERNWKASRSAIKKVEEAARVAYASLREEMMGLRETLVPGEDIFPVLTEYLSRFQNHSGIQSRLQVKRLAGDKQPLALSPNVEIQLLRIVQEGLTNVHRHANAHHVQVDCMETAEMLYISIQDDGEGFVPENVPEGHLGLRIMSERAASVGGQVSINSELGRGTRLEIEFPREAVNRSKGSVP